MKQLRILHVITRLDKGGSAENTLLTVLGNLEHGHHVELLCGVSEYPPSENEENARKKGAVIRRYKNIVRQISPVKDCISLIELYTYMKRHPCDVLHTHTSKTGIVARIAGVCAGIKCIVHTPHGHIFYGYFSPFFTNVLISIERLVTRKTSALITLTNKERSEYLERNIGTPERIYPVLSGLDLEPFLSQGIDKTAARKELGLPQDAYISGTVARLVEVKNHDLIISAASILADTIPELIYVFAGDGDLHERLENRIKSLGLSDRFIFLGWRNDTVRLLKSFDLFTMCSHNEGMGRAFVEAQASGLPVIGSTVGGIPEVLQENITGYLVPDTDPEALAKAIKTVYSRKNERETIAEACRQWVNPKFSTKVMVDTIESIYMEHLDRKV